MSDFSGLRLALTALQAQQRGVETSAQNVANANTEGYSRQRVDFVNIGAPSVPAIYSTYTGSGGGVRIDNVTRFRDQFMEIRAALEHGSMASLDQSSGTMNRIQQLFSEPTDTGLGQQIADFWSGFDDVANHPDEPASRVQLLQRADTLAQGFNQLSSQLSAIQTDVKGELGATVADINSMAGSVAQLNAAIKANTISGLPVNDLLDQRDLLVNKLAEAAGASVRPTEFGMVSVVIGGTALVTNDKAQNLTVDTSSGTVLRWAGDNSVAQVTTGKAGGELTAINSTIPSYISKVDTVATTLRDQVNQVHSAIGGTIATTAQDQTAAGAMQFSIALDGGAYATASVTGADWSGAGGAAALQTALQTSVDTALGGAGNATVSVTGGNGSPLNVSIAPVGTHQLLVKAAGSNTGFGTLLGNTAVGSDGVGGRAFFSGTDALSLAVSSQIAGNPAAVAAGTAAGGPLDASVALNLADMSELQTGADSAYRQLVVQLGVDTQTASSRSDIQNKAAQSLDAARSQQSGVSIDEEMTNLVAYQHAYDAAARFLTTIDTMLDTLINHTGLVA